MKKIEQGNRFSDPNGPTRRTGYKTENAEEMKQVLSNYSEPGEWLGFLESRCRETLSGKTEEEISRIANGKTNIEIDSLEGYAARILNCIQSAQDCASRGNIADAMDWALMAGSLSGEGRVADWHSKSKSSSADIVNERYRKSEQHCIKTARELWANDSDQEIDRQEMLRLLHNDLKSKNFFVPGDPTLWGYLTGAGIVPQYASRPGRKKNRK